MLSRIRAWLSRADGLPDELKDHIESLKEEFLALGATGEEASRRARQELGNRRIIRETVHEMRPLWFFDSAARHIRFAVRTLIRNKGAYLAAAAILTLGVGMSAAMFSLVDAALLRPLPFPNQGAIRVIRKADPLAGQHIEELAYPELRDLEQNIPDLEYTAVMPTSLYGYAKVLQKDKSAPVQIESAPVSHDFFRVLGLAPVLGRGFSSNDEHVGAPPVVVVSDTVWRTYLDADPTIIGRMIRLNGQGYTVIGVTAPGAEFPLGAGMWVPLGIEDRIVSRRGATFLQAIVRVRPGVTRTRLFTEVNALFQRLAVDHPGFYSRSQVAIVTPLVEYMTGSARLHLWIMLSASVLLLLASVISAGNLLLSRTLARRPELATRLALGAGRTQILAQLGSEGALVAIAALFAGMCIAVAAIRFLVALAPADIPRLNTAALNLDSFCFAGATAIVAAIACTVVPGWSAARMPLESALREGGTRSSLSRRAGRTRSLFVLTQAAVTIMLLAMACLLVLSYRSMMSVGTGFANRDAVSMNLQLRGPGLFSTQGFDLKSRRLFYSTLLSRLRQSPGVTSAAAILLRPLEGTVGWDVPYEFEFQAGSKNTQVLPKVNYEVVTPDYFRTVGTSLLEGRDFNDHDSEDAEPVVIVSQSLAHRIRLAGHTALGSRIRLGLGVRWNTIVGVSSDARYRSIAQPGDDIFASYLQAPQPTNYLVIRGTRPAEELSSLVRSKLAEMDSTQAIAGVATLGRLIDNNAARHRFNMMLLLWFAGCAAVLAAAGVYSVIAETMAAKEREIAIRTALGARKAGMVRDLVSRTVLLVLAGEAIGAFIVAATAKLESDLLYGVSARDPLVLGSVAAFLFVVSLGAAFCPAWFAASKDPHTALRAN